MGYGDYRRETCLVKNSLWGGHAFRPVYHLRFFLFVLFQEVFVGSSYLLLPPSQELFECLLFPSPLPALSLPWAQLPLQLMKRSQEWLLCLSTGTSWVIPLPSTVCPPRVSRPARAGPSATPGCILRCVAGLERPKAAKPGGTKNM